MMTITDYINMKAENLKNKLAGGASLCSCSSLRFDAGRVPDYNDSVLQDVYALRYALAYAFEYKVMYNKLLERMTPGYELEVVSLGCGNMIDYWSLRQVVPASCHIHYHGVDAIDWKDKFSACLGDTVDFTQQDIFDYLNSCENLTADVYIFPKSISELTESKIYNISQIFLRKNRMKEEIHFLFSLRENDYSLKRDLKKTQMLYEYWMQYLGMESQDSPNRLFKWKNDELIYNCDRDFGVYNLGEAYKLLENLPEMCENYTAGRCCACAENRTQPMLRTKYMRFQIFTFREAA